MLFSKYRSKQKHLIIRKKKFAGRNNTGRITVAHQGGGHKQLYRKIEFKGTFLQGTVIAFEYDPNRTARLAKICSINNNIKTFFYILAPQNLKVLDVVSSSNLQNLKENSDPNKITVAKQIGSCYYLNEFNIGDFLYNIEISPQKGGQIVRAGGSSGVVLQKTEEFATIKLPSGEHRLIPINCKAFFGNLANDSHKKLSWKKAGKSRWMNIRPTVRGVAKNPIDHPHGGNTSGGCHPVTPWARLTKGKPTRSKKKKNNLIIKFAKQR